MYIHYLGHHPLTLHLQAEPVPLPLYKELKEYLQSVRKKMEIKNILFY
jgi:hypothetical protein